MLVHHVQGLWIRVLAERTSLFEIINIMQTTYYWNATHQITGVTHRASVRTGSLKMIPLVHHSHCIMRSDFSVPFSLSSSYTHTVKAFLDLSSRVDSY